MCELFRFWENKIDNLRIIKNTFKFIYYFSSTATFEISAHLSSRNESNEQCSELRQPWYVTVCKGKQCISKELRVRKNQYLFEYINAF